MRTQEEILERIKERKPEDVFGFEWLEYAMALTRESAETLKGSVLKADVDLEDWPQPFTKDEEIRSRCVEYMEFAWEKANDCRGISSWRSLAHYKAWLWLLGSDEFDDIEDYEYYGKDELVCICEYLGLDASQWDDGIRVNSEDE